MSDLFLPIVINWLFVRWNQVKSVKSDCDSEDPCEKDDEINFITKINNTEMEQNEDADGTHSCSKQQIIYDDANNKY